MGSTDPLRHTFHGPEAFARLDTKVSLPLFSIPNTLCSTSVLCSALPGADHIIPLQFGSMSSTSPPLFSAEQLPCSLLGHYSVFLSLVPRSWALEDLGKCSGARRLLGNGLHNFQLKLLQLIPGVCSAWRAAHILSQAAKISAGALKTLSQETRDEV